LYRNSHISITQKFTEKCGCYIFGRPLGPGLCHRKSVRLSVCNVGVLWQNGLSDRDDFWHTPCPGQQWPCIRRRSESPTEGGLRGVLQNVPRHVSCIMGVLQNVPRHVPVGHLSTSWALVMYIRVKNYGADMKLNVLDGRTDEHLVTV